MTRAEMLTQLLTLTGAASGTETALCEIVLDRTIDKVLAFLHREEIPYRACSLVVEMAADAYRSEKLAGTEAGVVTGSVQSISDNGQSVTYRDGSETLNRTEASFSKDYAERLIPFRKAGW